VSADGCAAWKPVLGSRSRDQVGHLRALNHRIDQLHRELAELVTAQCPQLLAEQGCGVLTAAIWPHRRHAPIGSDASLARLSGTAPIPRSSGQRTQHRLNRGGDRQLNHAVHIIAITRAQQDSATKQYLARKQAEGKTTNGALRCLKRHLARRIHQLPRSRRCQLNSS
jgi:transposase